MITTADFEPHSLSDREAQAYRAALQKYFGKGRPVAEVVNQCGTAFDREYNEKYGTSGARYRNWHGSLKGVLNAKRDTMQIAHYCVLREVFRRAVIACYGEDDVDEELLDQFMHAPWSIELAGRREKRLSLEINFGPENENDCLRRCLVLFSKLQINGSPQQIERCLALGQDWLKTHPDDVFLRSVYLWVTFGRATPDRVLGALGETARFLAEQRPPVVMLNGPDWDKTLKELRQGGAADRVLLRDHIEDALCRAAVLQWLRTGGRESALARRLRLPSMEEWPEPLRAIFQYAQPSWRARGVDELNRWLEVERDSATAHLLLLLLSGTLASHLSIPHIIDRVQLWIDASPRVDDPLIRWGLVWLSGMVRYRVDEVIADTREWLMSETADDDRLVRGAYLWLVGSCGRASHVRAALRDLRRWTEELGILSDGSIRVPTIVWLADRARVKNRPGRTFITKKIFDRIVVENQRWVAETGDVLVQRALELVASHAANDEKGIA